MSHVAARVSSAVVRVILGVVVDASADVDVILADQVLEPLVQVLPIGDHLVLGLSVIRDVHVVGTWRLDLCTDMCEVKKTR